MQIRGKRVRSDVSGRFFLTGDGSGVSLDEKGIRIQDKWHGRGRPGGHRFGGGLQIRPRGGGEKKGNHYSAGKQHMKKKKAASR